MNIHKKNIFLLFIASLILVIALPSFAGEKIKYRLRILVEGGGSVNPGVGDFYYDAGTTAFINAIPSADWAFDQWQGAITGTDLYAQVLMNSNKTVTAIFVPAVWRLTIEHSGNAIGFTSFAPGTYGFKNDQKVPLMIGTSPGVYFGGWTGDIVSNEEFIQIVMNSDKYVNAKFTNTGYILNLSVIGQGGTTPFHGVPHRYSENLVVSVVSYATNSLWRFDHWEGDIGDNEPLYYILMQLPMDQNRNITAVFIEKPNYKLTLEIIGEGSVSVQEGFNTPVIVSSGVHEFTFLEWSFIRCERILSSPGWKFLRWEGDYGDTSPTYSRCSFSMDKNRNIRCIFTNKTQVPNVVGLSQNIAENTIINSDLTVGDIIEVCGDDYPSGYVVNQSPLAGTTIEIGNSIDLWVSTGPCLVPVPNVVEMYLTEAENMITNTGLILGEIIEQCNDEIEPGKVISQSPPAGERIFPGSTIDIIVSIGPCLEGEGIIEGEGTTEGSIEGTPEGENCIWADVCPNFNFEGIKYGYYFGILWENCDSNQSGIPDAWEIEIVKYLLCNPQGIWENQFICKYTENYNVLKTELQFYTSIYAFRHILTGLLTLGYNIEGLKNIFSLTKNYTPFEYPSETFPCLPDVDLDNDGMTNYEEYLHVVSFNGTKEVFVKNIFNPSPVPAIHSADSNQDGKISLAEMLRIIQFLNCSGFHCEEGTEDGYAPGYDENFDFSCPRHTADYLPPDWHISLEEILRMVQFFNSNGYQICPFLSEDNYCPIF